MAERQKAYYVEEAFHGAKTQLVFANSADEAKAKCRKGDIELCVSEEGPHPVGIRSVRRERSEDR
ncbi:MAG TPA: hypothetical protein VHO06_22355 [Polyangia bacterium]|nr:hypothetical protein [Polyangia bacterium]